MARRGWVVDMATSHVMQTSELLAWVASGIVALLGGWAILGNYATVIRWYVRRKHGSLVPLFGGLLFAAAMFISPLPGVRRWAWLPFVVDLGCSFSLPGFLYSVFVLKCFKKSDDKHEA